MPRPERTYRTDAIILRRHDFGEADRLLTIYTPEFGKLSAISKGARRPTARQTGHVELFARTTLMLARGRELDIVTQAEVCDSYLPLHADLDRISYANYMVELLDRFTEHGEQNVALYRLLMDSLGWIGEPDCDLRLTARYYELALLRLVGFQPDLFSCVLGAEPIEATDQFFSAIDGGAVCTEHADGYENPQMIAISLNALKTLRYLQPREFKEIRTLKVRPELHFELENVMQFYVSFLLERRLKSADFIRQLRSH